MELLLWIKLGLAIALVIGLSLAAEYASPKTAGFLAGYPTGTAITLFFFGWENGARFGADSALFNVAGMSAMQSLIYGYYLASRRFPRHSLWAGPLGGVAGYGIAILILYLLQPGKIMAPIIAVGSIFVFIALLRGIPDEKIPARVPLNLAVLGFRAGVAGGLVLLITGIAQTVGTAWAGLFSAFPMTLLPLVFIVHYTYGGHHAHSVIKHLPRGLGASVSYSFSIALGYPVFGVGWGTALALAAATAYMLAYVAIRQRWGR
jgi:hypothetical protein